MPPNRSGSFRARAVSSFATASGVAPGAILATSGEPNRPGTIPSGRMRVDIHSSVPSLGNRNSGGITPTIVRLLPAIE